MTVTSRRPGAILRKLAAAAAIATTLATPLTGSPAFAGAPDDLWKALNATHTRPGCSAYGGNRILNDLALDYAKSMAFNNGRTQTTAFRVGTDELLNHRGYPVKYWYEMDYYNPNGGGSVDAVMAFIKKNFGKTINDCGFTQAGVAIWSVGKSYGATIILGTPK